MDIRHINIDWKPELERPVLIAGFTGWNDAADAASVAVGALASSWEARRFGGFDGEEFFDFQTTRPQVKLVDGVTREIEWPENMLSATEPRLQAAGSRGAVLLTGPEPNFRWRTFSTAVVELAKALNVELVVTMGALLADVPHSRPVSVSANSQDATLVESLSLALRGADGHHRRTAPRVCRRGPALGELLGIRAALPARRPVRPRCPRPPGQAFRPAQHGSRYSRPRKHRQDLPGAGLGGRRTGLRYLLLRQDARRTLRLPGRSGSAQSTLGRRTRPGTRRFPARTQARGRIASQYGGCAALSARPFAGELKSPITGDVLKC